MKTADKILEKLIQEYAEGHADHVCAISRKANDHLLCQIIVQRLVRKLGKDRVKELLEDK